ncbi:MAG: hypothetical protein UX07_C0009G0015 [Parcubacteria group bacterium GW2011_GWA2_45_30]|nr:MAG: hypothetical protein UX07_C0009G0015 [Parcubacteria group bacterium GW2011_GWA2_45_30]
MKHSKAQNLNIKHWFLIGIAALLAAFSVIWAEQRYERELERDLKVILQSKSAVRDKYALLEVDFGNGKKRYFQGDVNGYQYTLSEVLDSAANNGKFSLTLRNGDIAELAGIYDSGGSWKIYLNDREQNMSADALVVEAGDMYALRYE